MMAFIRKHALVTYFVLVYAVSGVGLIILGLPRLDASAEQNPASLAVFPVLIVSVALAGVAMNAVTGGRAALRELAGRLNPRRVRPAAMFALVLVFPAGALITLLLFTLAVSTSFKPGLQWFGLPIGLVAGLFEEIGWTGFAYPRMKLRFGPVAGAILLGVMWGIWHLPVVDSLGAASPHRAAWPAFFLAFVALVTGVRCVICWAYNRTGSVLLAQLLHASFTGTLILFSAPHVTSFQEAAWYAGYAVLLGLGLLAGAAATRSVRLRPATQ
jgi:membrane protease YdiL (CAAX protease family)